MCEKHLQNPFPKALPGTRIIGKAIHWYPETESTNIQALESPCCGEVFIAEHQTAGRGRHGRKWHSAPGLGLWFSVALTAPLPGVGFGGALAVRDALASFVPVRLRWPNDLYCGSRKVGGILVEQRENRMALGVGINVNHQPAEFPPLLRHRAGSLAMAAGRVLDRPEILVGVLMHLDAMIQRLARGEAAAVRDEWVEACDIIGRKVRRGNLEGVVTALDTDGALILSTVTGIRRVGCGDITIVETP